MIKQNFIFLLLLNLFISSCGPSQSEYDSLRVENENLKLRIAQLEKELDELKFGAGKLYSQAETAYKNMDYEESKTKIGILIQKHPASPEAEKAKILLQNIENAIKAKEIAEKERIANAVQKMKTSYDEVNEITWYKDKTIPLLQSNLHLYIGTKKNSKPWLRLYIFYYASDWLFIDSFTIKVDDKVFTVDAKNKVERDNGSGSIWEWYDGSVSKYEYEMIDAILKSQKAILRHNGKYAKDREITKKEKTALQNALDVYKVLGGDFNF